MGYYSILIFKLEADLWFSFNINNIIIDVYRSLGALNYFTIAIALFVKPQKYAFASYVFSTYTSKFK